MKYAVFFLLCAVLISCGTKVPYTNDVRDEFALDTDKQLRKVQFYTSATIILEKSKESGNQGTSDDGALVTNSSKTEDRVIIPVNTKCVFDGFGPNGELALRFEVGVGKTISFAVRPNMTSGKYYLVADWTQEKGGKLTYGNETYYAGSSSGNAYLMVVLKKLQKTKRKDRVVRGMKV
ncbi:MAG: hypothetical protein ACK5EK_02285 [Flavobacteriia bacterium]|jgi:hypothetical protein